MEDTHITVICLQCKKMFCRKKSNVGGIFKEERSEESEREILQCPHCNTRQEIINNNFLRRVY